MLDFRTQSQLLDATAAMMRSCLAATTNTWAASACRGVSLWAELMGAGSPRPAPAPPFGLMLWPSVANWMTAPQLYAWPWLPGKVPSMAWTPFARTWLGPSFSLWAPLGDWGVWGRASMPGWSGWLDAAATPMTMLPAPVPASADRAPAPPGFSSYRSSGGHAVAQVMVPTTELAELTATAVLSPMHTMLGVWRAALGG